MMAGGEMVLIEKRTVFNLREQNANTHKDLTPMPDHTGDKGSITQWVHAEYMEGSETIRPTFTQWVRGGYFSKVPTKVPTG